MSPAAARAWLTEARTAGVGEPGTVAFVTVGQDGRPSARTVLLKRLEEDALVFTSALWTRKAREAPSEAQARAATTLTEPARAVGLRLTKRGAGELGYRPRKSRNDRGA